jgi:hypothetical protein
MLFAMCVLPVMYPAVYAQQSHGTLYRWTDDKGVMHFGDRLPPEAVKQEREVLDKRGDVKKVLAREKTQAEIDQEATQQQLQQHQADYDKSLLQTYGSVSDIEKVREDRLATFDLRLQQAQKQVNDTQATLADLRAHPHDDDEQGQGEGEAVDPDIERQITAYESALSENYNALAKLRAERQRAADQFQHDIERFKQIKGVKSDSAIAKPKG